MNLIFERVKIILLTSIMDDDLNCIIFCKMQPAIMKSAKASRNHPITN